jgi:hypothetical protein
LQVQQESEFMIDLSAYNVDKKKRSYSCFDVYIKELNPQSFCLIVLIEEQFMARC